MIHCNPRLAPLPSRERILDAAERLLAHGGASFSMRELAAEAQVSFATPFNHFGSKAAIMLALSARRIERMRIQVAEATMPSTAVARVHRAIQIAARVMLEAPTVNRAVMGSVGAPSDHPGDVWSQSAALWALALGTGEGLAPVTRRLALAILPQQLAVVFRGMLSFWTAGELADGELIERAHASAAAVLLGFVGREERAELLAHLDPDRSQ